MANLYDVLSAHRDNKRDKKVFGLVVQGGGMRAVYSASALVTFIEYGLADAFDHVVGSSAGAINGAYFLCKQPQTASIYGERLASKKFVNLLRREKRIDIDYLVDSVLKPYAPVDFDRLKKMRTKLHIILTNAKTGMLEDISDHKDFEEIYEEIRATAALPILYDKEVRVGNKWYVDGGVADLIPLDVAYKAGCTDIVMLMTQQIASYRFDRRHDRLVKHLMKKLAHNNPEAVRKKIPTDEHLLQVNLRRLKHPWQGVRVYLLEPSDEEILISKSTIDRDKVEELAKLGVKDTDKFLHKQLI